MSVSSKVRCLSCLYPPRYSVSLVCILQGTVSLLSVSSKVQCLSCLYPPRYGVSLVCILQGTVSLLSILQGTVSLLSVFSKVQFLLSVSSKVQCLVSLVKGPAARVKSDTEARSSFESPRSLPTPELLSQPDFGYITRLASQAPRQVYQTRHPREMTSSQDGRSWEARLQTLQERSTPCKRAPPSTGGLPSTSSAELTANAWASLGSPAIQTLAASRDQALKLALAAKAKLGELQPGRDSHEMKFLLNLMEDYPQLPEKAQRKLLHRLNMIFIAVTRNWSEAIAVAGDSATAAIYPPGYQPQPTVQQIIYRDRPTPRAPRGRGGRRRK
uniref:Uncharacterized protein n=1 Tax=Timema douglasi TaxID=61478 RepID=A0A7R8VZU9_TIMDO|nr:unnamed protein product [Timema douglasi]